MKGRLRLLPHDPEIGWTPYAWLVYLLPFLAFPFLTDAGALELIATGIGVTVFLALYFAGYWSAGGRLLAIIGGITAIGCLFLPANRGAAVFFIYAASFAAWVRPSARVASGVIAAVVGALIVEALLLELELMRWLWGAVFAALIGGINIHQAQTSRANARLRLAQHEIESLAKTAERERIARDLHDVLGHTLSLIVLKSELASKLADRDPARAIAEIRDVERISRAALTEVRAAVTGYRAAGIGAELDAAAEALASASVRLEVARAAGVEFTESEEAVIALMLREAVTNVMRHARATRCSVVIDEHDGNRRVVVEDDGGARTTKEGVGLTGMRERIEAIGGQLEISSGRGMRLLALLPARAREAAAS